RFARLGADQPLQLRLEHVGRIPLALVGEADGRREGLPQLDGPLAPRGPARAAGDVVAVKGPLLSRQHVAREVSHFCSPLLPSGQIAPSTSPKSATLSMCCKRNVPASSPAATWTSCPECLPPRRRSTATR